MLATHLPSAGGRCMNAVSRSPTNSNALHAPLIGRVRASKLQELRKSPHLNQPVSLAPSFLEFTSKKFEVIIAF
jgi:hypothetical protein